MVLVSTGLEQGKTEIICGLCIVTVRISEVRFRQMTLVLNDEWMLMETAYIVVLLVYIF